jgi:ElaB/YqjD/DUF883 family membrane-anchored ribosome-binding protein
MSRVTLSKVLAGLTVAGALALSTPAVALAESDRGPRPIETGKVTSENKHGDAKNEQKGANTGDSKQQKCLREIDRRLADLDKLLAKVANPETPLTDAHRTALTASLTGAKTDLTSLRAKIAADTDPAVLKADCKSIYTDFRIYALRLPQAHLVISADRAQAQQAKFDDLVAKLEQAIADAGSDPNVPRAQDLLNDLKAKVASALAATAGVADGVIGLQPADWNANHDVLDPFVAQMRQARRDFKAASKDGRLILALLSGEGEHFGIEKAAAGHPGKD